MTITKLRPRRPIGLACSSQSVRVHFARLEAPSARVYSLCAIEAYSPENRDMAVLKDGEKSESTTNDLDDMWHMEDNEGNTKYFEDEDVGEIQNNEYFREKVTGNFANGLHVPHNGELEELQDDEEEPPPIVEIDLLSILTDG